MTISAGAGAQTITEHELAQAELFEENGYVALTPGGPDDPDTVEDAKAHCQTLHRGAVNNSRSRGTPAPVGAGDLVAAKRRGSPASSTLG